MKICDLTQFYSPVSGGVKRYLGEKVRYLREHTRDDEHILIVPGAEDRCDRGERARVYTIRSPLISRTSQYRILWRLEAVERILEQERPDLIESGDPYQVGWKAMHSGRGLRLPVIGFYHSHFPEAYLRPAQRYLGRAPTEFLIDLSRRYVRCLYNRFDRTIVPSPALGELLTAWGVRQVVTTDFGVDTAVFHLDENDRHAMRQELGVAAGEKLLLYVGRLAAEKNTLTLFDAVRELRAHEQNSMAAERDGRISEMPRARVLIIGDGLQRGEVERLRAEVPGVSWIPYCGSATELARYYRAADLFVHPGVQETFGLVTLEAQACGTPVVGIRGSYMDRIILGSQRRWASENSPTALAAAIGSTLAQPPDCAPEEMAAAVAARYTWTRVFEGLFDLYRQVAAEYRALSP